MTQLNLLVFLGTVRESSPPNPPRLGLRVARACLTHLLALEHDVSLVDPLDLDLPQVFKPHFSFSNESVPEALEQLSRRIEAADGYVMVSPEYNHAMSPALANLLNHFGSSLFSYKPSAIVTYSAGQWGGLRAAVNMRTFLSELGCLPVSAMIHMPVAQSVLDEAGAFTEGQDAARWHSYFNRTFGQLVWWGEAAARHRASGEPRSAAFRTSPSQRNAP